MSEPFTVTVEQAQDFQFLVNFNQDGVPLLATDEMPPLGNGQGPNPARLLAAAVANCLAASLLFCLRKSRVEPHQIRAIVEGEMVRNERGRMRIEELRVRIEPVLDEADLGNIGRCTQIFEDFCIVTESVRNGIDVLVELTPTTENSATKPRYEKALP
ncbi:MAG TPA: OsmC family protein [Longimicrobiales bacterium]